MSDLTVSDLPAKLKDVIFPHRQGHVAHIGAGSADRRGRRDPRPRGARKHDASVFDDSAEGGVRFPRPTPPTGAGAGRGGALFSRRSFELTAGDGSRTIRGGFEGRRAADAPSGQASGPGDAAAPFRECVDFEASAAGAGATGGVPGGILTGSWAEPSRTVRGRFEVGSRGSGRRMRRQDRPADPAMPPLRSGSASILRRVRQVRARPVGSLAGSFREAGEILPGSFRDPSGKLAGTFQDGSRASGRRKGRQNHAGDLGDGAEPGDRRQRPEGPWSTPRAAASSGSVESGVGKDSWLGLSSAFT